MRPLLATVSCVVAVAAYCGTATGGTIDAHVENLATITLSASVVMTNFDFDLSGCPAGQVVAIQWAADQPEPGTHTEGAGEFNFSTGDQVQRFTLSTTGGFRPGFVWEGAGSVACGSIVIPVSGTGGTKSAH
jgi:hypothetical protein